MENKIYDPYKFTAKDYFDARQKWRERIVGSPEMNDLTDPAIKEKIDIITKRAESAWSTMNKNEDRCILWGDKPPVESFELGPQYNRLANMAIRLSSLSERGARTGYNQRRRMDVPSYVRRGRDRRRRLLARSA